MVRCIRRELKRNLARCRIDIEPNSLDVATMWRSMSYAVGTFCLSSAGMYEFCQRRRALERKGMERATEIIERKKIEKERMRESVRAERRRRREEEEEQRREEEKEEEEKKKRSRWKSSWWA